MLRPNAVFERHRSKNLDLLEKCSQSAHWKVLVRFIRLHYWIVLRHISVKCQLLLNFSKILTLFKYYFSSYMEWKGILVHDSDVDLFVLHFVAFPLLLAALERCKNSWNHHKIRTEKEMTPFQLYIMGLSNLAQAETEDEQFSELDQVLSFFLHLFLV